MKDAYFGGPTPSPARAAGVPGAFPAWWAASCLICPLLVVAAFFAFRNGFWLDHYELPTLGGYSLTRGPDWLAAIHAARIYWATALFLATLFSLALVAHAGALIRRAPVSSALKWATLLVSAAIFAGTVVWPGIAISSLVTQELTLISVETTFDAFTQLALFLALLFATALLVAAGVALAVATVTLRPTSVRELVHIQVEVRNLLGLATLWLIIGVLGIGSLHRFASMSTIPEFRPVIDTMGSAATVYSGAFYSALLAATFAPAEILLRRAGLWLAAHDQSSANGGTEKWLQDQGFNLSVTQSLGRVLAILSPLIAGFAQGIANLAP